MTETAEVEHAVLNTIEALIHELTRDPADGLAVLFYVAARISIDAKNDDASFETARQSCVDNFNAAYAELLAQQEVKH
jgi:hypothetical protein